jgi:hypothetical protein
MDRVSKGRKVLGSLMSEIGMPLYIFGREGCRRLSVLQNPLGRYINLLMETLHDYCYIKINRMLTRGEVSQGIKTCYGPLTVLTMNAIWVTSLGRIFPPSRRAIVTLAMPGWLLRMAWASLTLFPLISLSRSCLMVSVH